jgi:hypothetical protein
VVGESGGAETCEETEGEIEAADEELCRETHGAGGNAEVGDEPEGSGSEGRSDASDESVEFGLGEAVEEEVGDDEIVSFVSVVSVVSFVSVGCVEFPLEREGECVG